VKEKRITRIEVIDQNGRSYVNWDENNDVTYQFQDDGRTLKVFVNTHNSSEHEV
jgi:hypothetical protein